jgi:hypothetical protein
MELIRFRSYGINRSIRGASAAPVLMFMFDARSAVSF